MGAKESKCSCITYEDAIKRVNVQEFKRLKEAFKRNSSQNAYISKLCFTKDVLGDYVPPTLAECIYANCGGTVKGITFKDLLCGLVLITRGTPSEKSEFLFNLYSNENGTHISKADFHKFISTIECVEPTNIDTQAIATLFENDDKVSHDQFCNWIKAYKDGTSLSRWLFSENNFVSLNNELDMPTFYQTLAGVTHLEEADIIDLEKVYWNLKEQSKSGKLDLETLLPMVSPPLPLNVCESFFNVFDENRDGHVDFKEMACGISAACRGPLTERQKFCFKMFDVDHDGFLSDDEVKKMVDILSFVHKENTFTNETIDEEVVMEDIKSHKSGTSLTVEEYVIWTVHNNLSMDFLDLIYQVCHIVLGLKPVSRQEENKIVCGWLQREERRGYLVGQFWCLVAIDWWHSWENYVTSPMKTSSTYPSLSFGKSSSETGCSHSMTFLPANLSGSFSNQSAALYNTQKGTPTRPGPIDNNSLIVTNSCKVSSLTGEGGKLKKHLQRIHDYELVPDSLWKALKRWYGASLYIPRQVIRASDRGRIELELYPITLLILRHQTQSTVASRLTYPQSNSWSGMAGGYGAAALSATNYSYSASVNTMPKRYLAHTATFSRLATIRHVYNYLCNRLKIRPEDVRLWQFYDENNMTLIEEEDFTLEDLCIRDDDQILLEIRNKDLTWPEEIGSLSANLAEKQNKQIPTERGATGLNNLGNTCFMNAALQCVSNTQALTLYFIKNMHLYELNRTNPLGMKGHIAKRYGDLIHDIWSGTAKTIAPLKLRCTIGKYAPQFSGFQQHDSQELLAFLLDGLHEDLNRVHDKPYLELKDSECRPDVAVAQEAWENHILRNKSIIVDLFHGQLKSKVTCKKCGHESVRFDPFNYLSLPLPMESYICIQCIVIKLNGTVPMKFSLRLNADDTYATVKQHLSQRCGVPSYLLKLVQISESNIKTVLTDDQKVKPTQNLCNVYYAYELPVNCNSSGSVSGDEERLSITSIRSTHREAAQTFTMIQRSVRPGNPSGQVRTISEDSTDSPVNSSSGGELCCSESSESTSPPADCSEILLEEMSGRLTVDSGHCSASSASLADSTDTTNGVSQQPSYIVALHRKMIRQDVYFVSSQKSKPSLFGFPVIVPCQESTSHTELYQSVWLQVARFVSPLPPSETTILNHATDCDDSLGYEFPFLLKAVTKDGMTCAWCPWYRFCRGCVIQCNDTEFGFSSNYIAIDWDPTALHLRYQTSQESEYECIGEQFNQKSSEPLNLTSCLEAFTTEEHLSDEEKYYCSKCKEHQPASKKLQIWRLPPILIIHLKRFQYMNGKWVKSQKVVKFPYKEFDLTDYLAAVPRETINRYRELKHRTNKKLKDHSNENHVSNMIVTPVETGESMDEKLKDNYELTDMNESSESFNEDRINKNLSETGSDICQKRKRLESTSLSRTPIDDMALQDFHQHRLKNEETAFDLKYNLYSVVCHSGILGGGHYVSYASNPNGKWYCYNDSSCREVNQDMDTSCAYMLFYEREGLDHHRYLPNVSGKNPLDIGDQDQDFESDYKKMCHLM